MSSYKEIKSISEAYRSMISAEGADKKGAEESQVNERVWTMSARDFGRKIDSIEDVHQEIRMSLVDSIEDINKRKKIENKLDLSYDQYFKVLSEIERMLK